MSTIIDNQQIKKPRGRPRRKNNIVKQDIAQLIDNNISQVKKSRSRPKKDNIVQQDIAQQVVENNNISQVKKSRNSKYKDLSEEDKAKILKEKHKVCFENWKLKNKDKYVQQKAKHTKKIRLIYHKINELNKYNKLDNLSPEDVAYLKSILNGEF